jgi:hypothetical protein
LAEAVAAHRALVPAAARRSAAVLDHDDAVARSPVEPVAARAGDLREGTVGGIRFALVDPAITIEVEVSRPRLVWRSSGNRIGTPAPLNR